MAVKSSLRASCGLSWSLPQAPSPGAFARGQLSDRIRGLDGDSQKHVGRVVTRQKLELARNRPATFTRGLRGYLAIHERLAHVTLEFTYVDALTTIFSRASDAANDISLEVATEIQPAHA